MSTKQVANPTSLLRFSAARIDITPPVGIYHRLWGAARHDRASGVHRPIMADVLIFAPADGKGPGVVRAQLDLAGVVNEQFEAIAQALVQATGLPRERVLITHSHTHSSGWFAPDRLSLPGGELILDYVKQMVEKLGEAGRQAAANLSDAVITYGFGRSNMAANRDYWDNENGIYACGYNPDAPADDTVTVARVNDLAGKHRATFVHYACHPTTLAWENSRISPDFIGGLREQVEQVSGVPCIYLQGPCGDLGPRDGFVGDTAVADRNGRQVAFAALSTLTAMDPALTDFRYKGPVISGATLGTWEHAPFDAARKAAATRFAGGPHVAQLPLRPRPDPAELQQELADWEAKQRAADAAGDKIAARDFGARAERARRWLGRLKDIPEGVSTFAFNFSTYRFGDAVWVTTGGEPYSVLQAEMRRRFPELTVIVSPLGGHLQVAYLLPWDRYGKGLYQEEPSILGQGCLEVLTEAVAEEIQKLR